MEIIKEIIGDKTLELTITDSITVIKTDEEFVEAGQELVKLQALVKVADEFFDPVISDAFKAHEGMCERKKSALRPITTRQSELKTMMDKYRADKETERKRQEKALQAMDNQDDTSANLFIEKSEQPLPEIVVPKVEVPKVSGTRVVTYYTAVVTDESKVPDYVDVAGTRYCIRAVDYAALTRLAKMTKSEIQIPGVEFIIEQRTEYTGR